MSRKDKRKRNRKSNDQAGGNPAWMTTYADMVTLLLAFFVLLYSYSVIDLERFQEIMSSLQVTFLGRTGILVGSPDPGAESGERADASDLSGEDLLETAPPLGEKEQAWVEMMRQMEETYREVKAFLVEAGLEDDVMLRLEERGVVMEMPERILFDSGEAVLRPESLKYLSMLSDLLRKLPNQVVVEGHTDNVPISTYLYPSNWELSVARAVRVARYLVEEKGLEPQRFIATGYGEYRPVDTNRTAEGRARNRRVTIVISTPEM